MHWCSYVYSYVAVVLVVWLQKMKCLKNTSDDSAALTLPSPNMDAGTHNYYVIDHSKLPYTAPHQLKSIRLVVVSETCENRVEVRFPSMCSLRAHFSGSDGRKRKMMMPALDEKCVMEQEVAEEVLCRRVLPEEIEENRDSWGFWVVDFDGKVGVCLSILKGGGWLKWGETRKRQFGTSDNESLKENDE